MEAIEIKRNPSCPEQLREMKIGEVRTVKLLGTTYNVLLAARARLRREGMDWLFEIDQKANEMRVTRVK